jgi:hypothetical protein
MDVQYYSMTVPSESELLEEFDGNCLLLKLPKKTFKYRDDTFYSEGLDAPTFHASTISLYMASQADPKSDMFYEYYVFVFPSNIKFDNSIYSSGDLVKSFSSSTYHEPKNTNLDEAFVATSLEWTIALKGKGYHWKNVPVSASGGKKKPARKK